MADEFDRYTLMGRAAGYIYDRDWSDGEKGYDLVSELYDDALALRAVLSQLIDATLVVEFTTSSNGEPNEFSEVKRQLSRGFDALIEVRAAAVSVLKGPE